MTVSDVKQSSSATCVLACVESILTDLGRPESQSDLFNRFPCDCSAHRDDRADGAVSRRHITSLLLALDLGTDVRFGPAPRILAEVGSVLERGGFILLATRRGNQGSPESHCVRLVEVVPGERLVVMDPNDDAANPSEWTWEELVRRECDAIAIWRQ